MTPLERYLSANAVAAVLNATTPTPDAAGAGAEQPLPVKENGAMTNATSLKPNATWRDLEPRTVILADPNHTHLIGEWRVESVTSNGWDVFVHVTCISGCERTFHIFQNTPLTIRPAEQPERAS